MSLSLHQSSVVGVIPYQRIHIFLVLSGQYLTWDYVLLPEVLH